jgi:hypothetical protein
VQASAQWAEKRILIVGRVGRQVGRIRIKETFDGCTRRRHKIPARMEPAPKHGPRVRIFDVLFRRKRSLPMRSNGMEHPRRFAPMNSMQRRSPSQKQSASRTMRLRRSNPCIPDPPHSAAHGYTITVIWSCRSVPASRPRLKKWNAMLPSLNSAYSTCASLSPHWTSRYLVTYSPFSRARIAPKAMGKVRPPVLAVVSSQ